MKPKPDKGSISRSSTRNMTKVPLSRRYALKLEPDVHEVIGRPGPSVLEFEPQPVLARNLIHGAVKFGFAIAFDQKRRVHDHFVADGLIVPRRYADAAQPFIDFAHVGDRALGQGLVDHAAQLHASEI